MRLFRIFPPVDFGQLKTQILRYDKLWLYFGIPLLSFSMHFGVLKLDLTGVHVWRQAQTQQAVDGFYEEDMNILHPRRLERGTGTGIFRMEFPLYQWIVAAFYHLFGQHVWVGRFISFLISCAAMFGMHRWLLVLFGRKETALIGAWVFAFSPVIYYYGFCTMPDILALTLAIWGFVFLLESLRGFSYPHLFLASLFLGLAVLVKLPLIVFYPSAGMLILIALFGRQPGKWRIAAVQTVVFASGLLPAAAWYATVIPEWTGIGAVAGIFHEDTDWQEILRILAHHAYSMFPRTLISIVATPILLTGLWKLLISSGQFKQHRHQALLILALFGSCLVYYAFEIQMINRYHDYYLLPFVPILVTVIALGAEVLFNVKKNWAVVVLTLLLVIMPLMTFRRIHPRWQPQNAEFNRDLLLHKASLRSLIPEDKIVVAGPDISHFIFLYYIHKKGWSWDEKQGLSATQLEQWIDEAAEYLYCDDRIYDTRPDIVPFLDEQTGSFGSVRVFRLRKPHIEK